MSYTTVSDLFKAICDSIRTKTGKSGTINHQDIPAEIDAIEAADNTLQRLLTDNQDPDLHPLTELSVRGLKHLVGYAFYYNTYLTSVSMPDVLVVNLNAFYQNSNLQSVSFPKATHVYSSFCRNCSNLESVELPEVKQISGQNTLANCGKLKEVVFPKLTTVSSDSSGFLSYCSDLEKVRFPKLQEMVSGSGPMSGCTKIKSADIGLLNRFSSYGSSNAINLSSSTVLKVLACRYADGATVLANTFNSNSPIMAGTGYVLVPRSLIATYQAATNWATIYAAGTQFLALEDYTTDGTLTGELDETKIDALLAS